MSREVQKAYREGYKKGYLVGFTKLQKTENKPIDERNGEGWISISAEEVGAENCDFRTEIANLKDEVNLLEGRIRKLERAFYGD